MVTGAIFKRPKTTIPHPASSTHRYGALSPELVDELRKRVEKLAHTPILALAKDLGLRLWKRLEDLDDWMGGAPSTERERERQELLEIHGRNSRNMVM